MRADSGRSAFLRGIQHCRSAHDNDRRCLRNERVWVGRENALVREQLGKVVGGRGRREVVDGGRANPRRRHRPCPCPRPPAASRTLLERVAVCPEQRKLDRETRGDAVCKGREQMLQCISWRSACSTYCRRRRGLIQRRPTRSLLSLRPFPIQTSTVMANAAV